MRALGHSVTVHNLAKSSTGSEYAASHILYDRPELASSGLIIVDTSINDWYDWNVLGKRVGTADSYDLLVQQLLELPHRPAVLELATLHFHGAKRRMSDKVVYCSTNISDFPHSRAELFQLPILSFPDAMCQCCGRDGLWLTNRKPITPNVPINGINASMHPNATTHDAVARMLVGALGLEMERACEAGGLQVPDHAAPAQRLQDAPFSRCLRFYKKTFTDFTLFDKSEEVAPFVEGHDGWQFARDLPTKPFGWLVPSGSPAGETIDLRVNASRRGWIRLDYLSTYDDIGSVTCWVDGVDPAQGCFINALMARSGFSMLRSAYIGLSGSLEAALLRCRSNGGKFKVLGIASC